jgi:hypothetical protein
MFSSSNFASWFKGGTQPRELADTHQAWIDTQAVWRASPFAAKDASEFALELTRESVSGADRAPATPILVGLSDAIETLLRAESVGDIEPLWNLIETDVEVAAEFRHVLARRKRWSEDHARIYGAFKRIILEGMDAFYRALPESCFGILDTADSDSFDVPLIDLLDDPVMVVDRLFMVPYDDDSFRLDIFRQLRELCTRNLLIASGFAPDANPREVAHKLSRAPSQKGKTGAELAQLYLNGSPFKDLVDRTVPFRIPDEVRFEHCHIVGGTGHGKTQLMQKMIHADLLAARDDGRSVIVIDSQGDLINKLVRLDLFAPNSSGGLSDRLVLIDPSDVEYPAALNLFDARLDRVKRYGPADRERVLNGVTELYELFFGEFLGAELTQKQGVIFKYLARLMLAIPHATIHTLMQIMEDGGPFKPYMEQLDGSARHFFETEFFHASFAATKKQVLRRLWGVLSTPAFERMFTQPKNKLDLFEAMNEGKIILVSTAKDLLKREGSQLLGRFFIAMIAQAALERSTLPERSRNPAFVYVDEAQEYFDDSIETILAQARKYHVGLALAHQTLDQLSPRLRSAILANTSIKCAGGVSAKDARALADELHTTPEFIDGMKRRGPRSEFALWVKHVTGQAIRLSVPLGFLERQPTLDEEGYEALVTASRGRYCGTRADTQEFCVSSAPRDEERHSSQVQPNNAERSSREDASEAPPERSEIGRRATSPGAMTRGASVEQAPGKGGKQHRYLQSLIKGLAEDSGLKATIEAPLLSGTGQVDVAIERDGFVAAIEVSVTTPVEHEQENLRRCLQCAYSRIAVVLAKSKATLGRYRSALLSVVPEADRERVSFLTPEEIPEYLSMLAPPPERREATMRGYKVTLSQRALSPQEARDRQEQLARVIARSLTGQS